MGSVRATNSTLASGGLEGRTCRMWPGPRHTRSYAQDVGSNEQCPLVSKMHTPTCKMYAVVRPMKALASRIATCASYFSFAQTFSQHIARCCVPLQLLARSLQLGIFSLESLAWARWLGDFWLGNFGLGTLAWDR